MISSITLATPLPTNFYNAFEPASTNPRRQERLCDTQGPGYIVTDRHGPIVKREASRLARELASGAFLGRARIEDRPLAGRSRARTGCKWPLESELEGSADSGCPEG